MVTLGVTEIYGGGKWDYRDTRIGKRLGSGVGYFGCGLDIRFWNITCSGCSFVYRNGYILNWFFWEALVLHLETNAVASGRCVELYFDISLPRLYDRVCPITQLSR